MNCSRSNILVLISLLCLSHLPAWGHEFPGKGDYQAWVASGQSYNAAQTLVGQGKYTDAAALYEKAIQVYPYDPAYYLMLGGACLKKMGKLSEAESVLIKGTVVDPTFANCWYQLGVVLAEEQKYQESKGAYQHALELNLPEKAAVDARHNIQDIDAILSGASTKR